MSNLDKALLTLNETETSARRGDSPLARRDARAKTLVTLLYLVALLSLPLDNLGAIILFALYPIIGASMADIPYGRIFRASLYTLPFIAFIGIFNPIFDHKPQLVIGSVVINEGWVQFAAILVRGLLCVQATVLLILSTGFISLCRGLRRMGLPAIFATQLFMLYRYIFVLLSEARDMERARVSRGYGRSSFGLRFWATFVGQLLLRTTSRAERIHGAMLSRGFSGEVPYSGGSDRWRWADTIYLFVWSTIFAAIRFCDIPSLFTQMMH
ncbi:MAG: cobalt ECF transporter T component CbiQ [Candidatus Amulumruptor caecigallinarius]|nr:cobalt ECF transporter T component CbiQ [Candidatus Amulumruptor caecigallinarius]MCM1396192.1 cobalt ECF transporter T component CbiQ [Candidatus Amulumruptor caecigallinarius]MCM1453808.1 cobalt ECF transporter T component CbiQ [bacterium]